MIRRILLPPLTEIGPGSIQQTPFLLDLLGIRKPFVLLDAGLPESLEAVVRDDALEGRTFVLAIAPAGEPTTQAADVCAKQARETGCDGVLAIGGGSVMDLGKAVSMLVGHPGRAEEYQGPDLVEGTGLRVICVPTTAGSGAEATKSAVLTNADSQVKRGINAVGVLPDAVILDPDLLISLPDSPRIAALLDATTHALESYVGLNSWQASEMAARAAFPHLGAHMRHRAGPLNSQEAESALLGSFFAGTAICNSETGAVHALAYPLTEYHGIPHAYAVAALLPSVMEAQEDSCGARFADAAELMGFASVRDFICQAKGLRDQLEIVAQVREIVADRASFARLVERAMTLKGALDNSPHGWSELDAHAAYEVLGQ